MKFVNFFRQKLRTLKIRLFLLAAFPILFILIASVLNLSSLNKLTFDLQDFGRAKAPLIQTAADMESSLNGMLRALYTVAQSEADSLSKSDAEQLHKEFARFEEAKKRFMTFSKSTKEQELYKPVADNWDSIKEVLSAIDNQLAKLNFSDSAARAEVINRVRPMLGPVIASCSAVSEALQKMADNRQKEINALVTEQANNSQTIRWMTSSLSLLGTILTLIAGIILGHSTSVSLTGISTRMARNAHELDESSEKIGGAGDRLRSAVSLQVDTLQDTGKAIGEINSALESATANVTVSMQVAESSAHISEKGHETVLELIYSIEEISNSSNLIEAEVRRSNEEIKKVTQIIADIAGKTAVINDIVFQTKLLSFNASVEAARAGEHGKGFAVVAEEIGNLAQMSGNAALEINQMLSSGIQRVQSVLEENQKRIDVLVRESLSKVQHGASKGNDCREVLEEVVMNVRKVHENMIAIAAASKQQAVSVSEISKSLAKLEDVSSNTALASEQANELGVIFRDQAHQLLESVNELSSMMTGHNENGTHTKRLSA